MDTEKADAAGVTAGIHGCRRLVLHRGSRWSRFLALQHVVDLLETHTSLAGSLEKDWYGFLEQERLCTPQRRSLRTN